MPTPLKLFVNYRRADEALFVELLRTHFMFRYGRENVFMDFDSIPPFTQFEDYIKSKVRECDVMAAIIGRNWLELLRAKEANGEPDYVRIELREGLRLHKVIAPILIQGAVVPPDDQIPDDLRELFALNIPAISSGRDVLDNIGRLMDHFERELKDRGIRRTAADPERAQIATEAAQERPSMDELIERFSDAEAGDDYPAALMWAAEMRAAGVVPNFFKLDQREAAISQKLQESEARQHRREAAESVYKFVRAMAKRGARVSELRAALDEVRAIDYLYDPDGIAKLWQGKVPNLLPAPFEWCDIPAGRVTIKDMGEYDVQPFQIAKYPITNGQFSVFLKDRNGYTQDRWWDFSEAALAWRAENKKVEDLPQGFKGDKQPRVQVSWYEAMAFCRWLSVLSGENISLPTEVQWQHAAQGGQGLVYPWGDEFDATCCNTEESEIQCITPVDTYRSGASPFGVMDMAGNVWELCLNVEIMPNGTDENVAGDRGIRGGSWLFRPFYATASYRGSYNPYTRSDYLGFRVVVRAPPV